MELSVSEETIKSCFDLRVIKSGSFSVKLKPGPERTTPILVLKWRALNDTLMTKEIIFEKEFPNGEEIGVEFTKQSRADPVIVPFLDFKFLEFLKNGNK